MDKKDNALVVVQKLVNHHHIPVSNQTITENLMSHPEYPSLKSICDSLNEWKVDNYPMRIDKDELKETESSFIAHLNDGEGKLAFVPKLNGDSKIEYFDSTDKSKTVNENDFFSKYSGVSLLIDPDKNSGEEGYSEKRQIELLHLSLPYLAGLALFFFATYSILVYGKGLDIAINHLGLVVTKIVGLGLSFLLVLKDLNINGNLANKLCNINKENNCDSLLNSAASKVFGWLHWSDVGLVYFLSGLLMVISFSRPGDFNLIAILAFCSLGYVIFSLYYQAIIAKTWCPVCLSVQIILLVEAMLLSNYLFPVELSWISILKYGAIFLTVVFGFTLYKAYFKNKQTLQNVKIVNLKFKKNPILFTNLLYKQKQKIFDVPEEAFIIGKLSSSVEVTVFLSLFCTPCQKTFNQLKTLFGKEAVKINLILSFQEDCKPFVNQAAQLFRDDRQKEAIKLLDSWYNTKGNKRDLLIKEAKKNTPIDYFQNVQKAHKELFKTAKILRTPSIFINGYSLPREYEIKDVANFIYTLKK